MWGSLEWILPVCKRINERYNDVETVFLIRRRFKDEIFSGNSELKKLTQEISGGKCYDHMDIAPRWIKAVSGIIDKLRKISRLGFLEKVNDIWFRVSWRLFEKKTYQVWLKSVKPDVVLTFSHKNALFRECKKRNIKIGFFLTSPSFAFSNNVWVDKDKRRLKYRDAHFDFFLVDTEWTSDFFKSISSEKPVFCVGTPKFDTSWIGYINKRRESLDSDVSKSTVLILLKNKSSYVFSEIEFEKTIKEIIETLIKGGIENIIMKPHPRQDLGLLEKISKEFKNAHISISQDPSFNLITKVQYIVSLPSGVILDVLLADKPVIEYFPYGELNDIFKRRHNRIPKNALGGIGCVNDKNRLTSIFRHMGFVIPADTPDELIEAMSGVDKGKRAENAREIRKIYPDNASEKAAETIVRIAQGKEKIK